MTEPPRTTPDPQGCIDDAAAGGMLASVAYMAAVGDHSWPENYRAAALEQYALRADDPSQFDNVRLPA